MPCRHGYAEGSVRSFFSLQPQNHHFTCPIAILRRHDAMKLQDHGSSICRENRILCVSSSHKAQHIGILAEYITAQGCASPKLEQNTNSPRAACNSGKFGDCRTWRQFLGSPDLLVVWPRERRLWVRASLPHLRRSACVFLCFAWCLTFVTQ